MIDKYFCSVRETVNITGLAECHIRKLIAEGKCPCIKTGNKFQINVPKFIAMLNEESERSIK